MRHSYNNNWSNSVFCRLMGETVNIFALSKQDTSVMKGIAIIAMLCHHVYNCQPEWVEAYPFILTTIGELGKVCVAMFLFCSGYGLAVQYEKVIAYTTGLADKVRITFVFILKRLIKFYSAYWFVFLIFVPITIFCFNRPLSAAYGENVNVWRCLFFDLLGVQGFSSYNITWWFNKLIILFYLSFPILYILIRNTQWLGLVASFIAMRFANQLGDFNYCEMFLWQFPFVLGIGWTIYQGKMVGLSKFVTQHTPWIKVGLVLLLLIGILQRLYSIIPFGHIVGVRFDGFLTLLILLCIILILRNKERYYLILSFLGKHSINIYLIHTFLNGYWSPVHQFLHTHTVCRFCGLNMWILLLSCLLISILIEYLKDKIYWNKLTEKVLINIK